MPSWMNDTPVEVDVHSLETYAKHVSAELETNLAPNAKTLQGRLAGEGSYNPEYDGYQGPPTYEPGSHRTFGADPRVPWAWLAGERHMEIESSITELLASLQSGMQTIASAAKLIAQDYSSVDARNAMDVSQVPLYFVERKGVADEGTGSDPSNAAR